MFFDHYFKEATILNRIDRKEYLQIRLSKEEKEEIAQYASKVGLSLSAFARTTVLKRVRQSEVKEGRQ